jgi:hypothetical protein
VHYSEDTIEFPLLVLGLVVVLGTSQTVQNEMDLSAYLSPFPTANVARSLLLVALMPLSIWRVRQLPFDIK